MIPPARNATATTTPHNWQRWHYRHLVAVTPAPDYRHIDTDVYRFARRGLRRDIVIDGQKVSVLKFNNDCRDLVLPFGAQVHVSYGLDSKRLADQGRTDYAARFRMGVRRIGTEEVDRAVRGHPGPDH